MGDAPVRDVKSSLTEQALFAGALERDTPSARAAYLDGACGADLALRRRVEELLQAAEQAGDFLEVPSGLLQLDSDSNVDLTEKPGDRLGRYKLLERIGEGGCGVVYMAEQDEPVRRRVALKIIKLGMDTRAVIARFEAERQALAMMDHPGIAKVFDGGATPAGRPYFVMELVRGVRITEFCEEARLSTEARLRLFVQVCQAVQHAHQKGIIHRDLKPSNLLVTINDGVPVPKVIDFGIAKATGERLTDKTLFTHFHAFMGTPAYTSPEQAEMSSVDIDTRTDIYSLGVLLYELLTGRPPFDGEELLRSGLDEMRRVIREVEPLKPSTRLTKERRARSDPSAKPEVCIPHPSIDSDLDWIVMKCLEKDRARRYETANGLAADIRRHLSHEAVVARPPSFGYRTGKWILRHKGSAIAGAAVVLALCAGLVASTVLYLRERSARAGESAQRAKAEIETAKSAQTARFLTDMLSGIDPDQARGRDVAVLVEMLEHASARVQGELKDQPEVEAAVRIMIGHVYRTLALYAKAQVHLEQARGIRERVLGREHPESLRCLLEVVNLYGEQGRFAEAEALCRQALEGSRRSAGPADPLTVELQQRLALACLDQRKFAEAERLLTDELTLLEQERGRPDLATLKARGSLGVVYLQQRKFAQAEPLHRETLAGLKRILDPEHPGVLQEMANLAATLHGLSRFAEAEALYRETWELEKRVHGPEHQKSLITMQNLATLTSSQERHAEAEALLRQVADIAQRTLGPEHPRTLRTLEVLTVALCRQGKFTEAEAIARQVLEINQRVLGREHARTLRSMTNLADTLVRRREGWTAAERLYREVLSVQNRVLGPEHNDSLLTAGNLFLLLRNTKDWTAAEALCRETVASNRRLLGDAHPATAEWTNHLAAVSTWLSQSAPGNAPPTGPAQP